MMVKILLIEDNPADTRYLKEILRESGLAHELITAESLEEGLTLLTKTAVEVLLTDLGLPDSQGLATFRRLHKRFGKLPTIVLTGLDDEEASMRAVKEGAQDYLVKGTFDGRALARTIRYAIERQRLLNEIMTLRGIVPICSYCKKIRDDEGYWQQLEKYIYDHTGAEFSHGMCPKCAEKVFADLEKFTGKRERQ